MCAIENFLQFNRQARGRDCSHLLKIRLPNDGCRASGFHLRLPGFQNIVIYTEGLADDHTAVAFERYPRS